MSRLTSRRRTLPHRALLCGQGKALIEVFEWQAFEVAEFQAPEVFEVQGFSKFFEFQGLGKGTYRLLPNRPKLNITI